MELRPILSTLRRNKVGAALVALQIALTLAVVANALSVIQHHLADMNRPSGMDEQNIFTLSNQWVGGADDSLPRIQADLAALRALPGVLDAEATNSFPLSGNTFQIGVSLKPNQTSSTATTNLFLDSDHGLTAQGFKLVAGRWFDPQEVNAVKMSDLKTSASVVMTSALARRLFPKGNALGQSVYLLGTQPARIIGVIERATAGSGTGLEYVDYATFMPIQLLNPYVLYVVRTKPGQGLAAMRMARQRLLDISRMRVLSDVSPFSATRTQLFAAASATNWLLATVCSLLLIITACGTVGLTMLWVAQRRRQIGIRRALGASRLNILRYFHTENLLICGTGVVLGIVAGLGVNLWLAKHLAVTRMSPSYIVIGAVVILLLAQLAVLWPAIRAAAVPPSLAARGL